MRYVLVALLFVFFFYALGLVVLNSQDIAINLVYTQSPEMMLGLVLVISITVGAIIGFLVAILLFRVFQNSLEMKRLKKDNSGLKAKLEGAHKQLEALENKLHVVEDTVKDGKPSSPPPAADPKKKETKIFGFKLNK